MAEESDKAETKTPTFDQSIDSNTKTQLTESTAFKTDTVDLGEGAASEVTKMSPTDDAGKNWKKYLKQAIPLFLLVSVNVLLTYTIYFVLFIGFILVFDWSNSIVLRQVQLQNHRSLLALILLFSFHIINTVLTIPLVHEFWLFQSNSFSAWWATPQTFWSTVFYVSLVDFIIKFLTMCIKCCVIVASTKVVPRKNQGGIFVIIEGISQTIRCIMPTLEWIKYIVTTSTCVSTVVCWLLAIVYIAFKVSAVLSRIKVVRCGWQVFRNPQIIGTPVQGSDEEICLKERNVCPICHERHKNPYMLPCNHAFCHDCCQLWFDVDQYCPVCASNGVFAYVTGSSQTLPTPTRLTGKNSRWKTGTGDYMFQLF